MAESLSHNHQQMYTIFEIVPLIGQPTYPALWSHDNEKERQLVLSPDREGRIRPGMSSRADEVWATSSRLHFNRDFGLNCCGLAAGMTDTRSLGGRAWPNFQLHETDQEAALALWSNTTLGLLLFWWHASLQQAGRAVLTTSMLPSLLVVDTRQFTPTQLAMADRIFDDLVNREFLPANEAYRDRVRIELDERFLVQVLGLDTTILEPLRVLRNKWCAEPSVHGGKSTKI